MSGSPRHRSATIRPLVLHDAAARTKFASFCTASPTPSTPTQHTGRFRAHLAHLLPRHAAFTVTVTIHQLHNVPLVHGEFGLKWKIKGVTSHSGTGILDKVKARKAKPKPAEQSPSVHPPTSLTRNSDTDNASLFDGASVSDANSVTNSSSTHDHSPYSASGHATRTQPLPIPAVVVSTNHPSPQPVARSSSVASMSSASSISSASPHANGFFPHSPLGYLSADWSRQGAALTSRSVHGTAETLSLPNGDGPKAPIRHHYSPAKGITSFVKLKEHSVVWEQTLKFVVQLSVARDNGGLGDCLAKFVVMQRVISGDPDAPRNPRLGAVYLNLAQYVDAGVVTRRHLLRQSKTNATLKLTIQVEHTAGETTYLAPPLPKGEILSGVTGLLESSDIYRTRPRASDLYAHAPSDSSSDDAGAASGSDASSIASGSNDPSRSQSHVNSDGHGHRHATVKPARRPFDVAKLPTISDPRGTEKLIEALFNPMPVTQPGRVTPFTYLVEVGGEGDGDGHDGDGNDGERGSYDAERTATVQDESVQWDKTSVGDAKVDDDGSLYADSPDSSADERDGMGSGYHSLRSYPSFQGSLQSKHSNRSLARCNDGGEETVAATGVHPLPAERRTWWQKVLSAPNVG